MSTALQTAALLCTLLALVAGTAVLARSRDVQLAVAVLLELLLAAGLLRLADDPGWREIAVTAAVVVLRRVLSRGLAAGRSDDHRRRGEAAPA